MTPLGPLATSVCTASHGGIFVSPSALARIPAPLRQTRFSQDGWFEEDCDWAIPYLVLDLHLHESEPGFGERLRNQARRTILQWHGAHAALLSVEADPPSP